MGLSRSCVQQTRDKMIRSLRKPSKRELLLGVDTSRLNFTEYGCRNILNKIGVEIPIDVVFKWLNGMRSSGSVDYCLLWYRFQNNSFNKSVLNHVCISEGSCIGRTDYLLEIFVSSLKSNKYLPMDLQPIDYLELSVRSYNCLKRHGISSVGHLVSLYKNGYDFTKIKNLGVKSFKEITEKLKSFGLIS